LFGQQPCVVACKSRQRHKRRKADQEGRQEGPQDSTPRYNTVKASGYGVVSMACTMQCLCGLDYASAYACFYAASRGHFTWFLVLCNESARRVCPTAHRRGTFALGESFASRSDHCDHHGGNGRTMWKKWKTGNTDTNRKERTLTESMKDRGHTEHEKDRRQ
jgi:hypothetical protein